MLKIECSALQYKNYNHHDIVLHIIDGFQRQFRFGQGVKDLFYELKDCGKCESVCVARLQTVREVLTHYNIPYAYYNYDDKLDIELIRKIGEKQADDYHSGGDTDNMITFEFHGRTIIDPFHDETYRESVNPFKYYGLEFMNSAWKYIVKE